VAGVPVTFLKFHDEDGDPIYVKNDIIGIFTKVDTESIGSMLNGELRKVRTNESRAIISQSTGRWEVRESYEEILDQIEAVPCA
jgi:hypothetical protein